MSKIRSILLLLSILFSRFFLMFMVFFVFHQRNVRKKEGLLFLEVFPIENTGYQYRAKKWADFFAENGYPCDVKTLVANKQEFDGLLREKDLSLFFIKSLWRRFFQLLIVHRYKTIIVRRELLLFNDYGNLFLEKFLLKIHPNVILDFDDDIAASKREPREVSSLYGRLMLENGNKFSESLHLYPRFIVGSGYLKEYLLTRRPELSSDNVLVVPTCVDYERHASHYYPEDKTKRTLGWVGIPENLVQLDFLIPILNRLAESFTFELLIISSRPYQPEGALFEVVNLTWDWSHEIAYLQKIDVGLMPLEDTPAARGKCGFKLIQYMGLGIPAIGSAVTVNKEIIASKDMGWLVITPNEWENALVDALSMSPELLARMGARARLHVEKNYSFTANFENYKSFVSSE